MSGKGILPTGGMGIGVRPGLVGPCGAPAVTPQMQMGMMGEKRRAWSPHAGSRAIRQCTKGDPTVEDQGKKNNSPSPSPSRSSSVASSSDSSDDKKKKKKKKKSKKKKKKKGSKSSKSSAGLVSSSSSRRSRSRSRGRDKDKSDKKEGDEEAPETKEIQEAKMEALKNLTKL